MRFCKKIISLMVTVLFLVLFPFVPVEARNQERDIKIWINDFYVMSDAHPFIKNGHTFVPIRFIAEELGYKVSWNGIGKVAVLEKKGDSLTFTIDSKEVDFRGEEKRLPEAALLKEERIFVPFRAITEIFGETVKYDAKQKIAIIGDNFDANQYYPVRYYLKNEKQIVADYKVNFVTYTVLLSSGKTQSLHSDEEIFKKIDEHAEKVVYKNAKESTYVSKVEKSKQIKDQYYVERNEEDPFEGSWYGTFGGHLYGMDRWMYIKKKGGNKYTYVVKQFVREDYSDNKNMTILTQGEAFSKENKLVFKKGKTSFLGGDKEFMKERGSFFDFGLNEEELSKRGTIKPLEVLEPGYVDNVVTYESKDCIYFAIITDGYIPKTELEVEARAYFYRY